MAGAYLTVTEFRNAPTAVDTKNLIVGGNQAAQDAELVHVIGRASAWIDNFVNRALIAATYTATTAAYADRWGAVNLHPGGGPLVSLTAVSVGSRVDSLFALSSLAGVWIADESFVVPLTGIVSGFAPTLELGSARTGQRLMVRYTYVAGYPNTTLAAQALAGATSITVADAAGIVATTQLTIYDGANTETVTVASVAGNVVTLTAGTAFLHAAPIAGQPASLIAVSALPADVKQAAIWVVAAFIKQRGSDAFVMGQQAQPAAQIGFDPVASTNMRLAKDALSGYARKR